MRIITGLAKGKKLLTPQGMLTRPTTDRIKESIFNIVQFDIEGRRVLDMFCGSGQMGLEALSRGALSCTFVDINRSARAAVDANIESVGFIQQCKVSGADALSFVKKYQGAPFDLIFLDPPYDTQLLEQTVSAICTFDILSVGGIIVCEGTRESTISPPDAPYEIAKEYNYGKTKITTVVKT